MKKLFYSMFIAAALVTSCSESDDNPNNSGNPSNGSFSNNPVSGVVYNEAFTIGGGKATSIMTNDVDSFYIYLNEADITCEESVTNPIWIIVPAEVGTYERTQGEMTLRFKDVNNGDFEGSLDAKIEITEITETMIKGKVMATGFYDNENNINGTFEVQYCPL